MKKYTLPRSNSMTFEYYINGKASRHFNTLGETTTFTYNPFRREALSVNERGHQRQYFFDKNANPIKIVEERGGERVYAYDTANPYNRVSKRDPIGYQTQYTYDSNGNVTKVTNPSGSTIEYSHFNTFNQPGKVKDPRGNFSLFKYSANGNVLQIIKLKAGIGLSIDPTNYTPMPNDLVAWTINTYDGFGNLLTTKRVRDFATQVGPTMEFVYDANNLNATTATRRGDKNGDGTIGGTEFDTATLVYDSLGRATTQLRPDWHLASAAYDSVDRVQQATDALGNTRTFGFDANGNLQSKTLVGSFFDQMTYAYDMSDRRTSSTNSGGFTSSHAYDAAGNVIRVTDPDGFTLSFDYDPNNKVISSFDQEGRRVSRTLDLDGKPRTVTDPNGSVARYEYYGSERDGRLKRQYDPVGRGTSFDYDFNGNVSVVTDNLGRTTLTTYDELNRPTRIVGPVFTSTSGTQIRPVTKNTYDTLGRLTQVAAGSTPNLAGADGSDSLTTEMTYLYDDFDRKLRETDTLGRSWNIQVDVNGNPVVVKDPKGQITLLSYKYGHQLLSRSTDATGREIPVVPLAGALKSITGQIIAPPQNGFSFLYRGGICVADGAGKCIGGDATKNTGIGTEIGYLKDSSGTGTTPVYQSTCYSDAGGTCTGYGLSLDTNGSPVGHLSLTAPDGQSVPFIQSNGLLLQGLTGTASAYPWSLSTTTTVTWADHFYSNDWSQPADYATEALVGLLRRDSGAGAVALKRFYNATTFHNYYSTVADQPSGFTEQATLGYLDTSSGTGLNALYRHFNSTVGDYLLSTSATPPSGYVLQTTLGYLQVGSNVTTYIRNPIGQAVEAKSSDVTYKYLYDAAHRIESINDSRGNKTISYALSAAGRRVAMQDSDANRTDYQYDPVGRLTGIWAPNNQLTSFVYDDGGRLTEKWFPNGVNTQYSYNPDNTLSQLINRHGSGVTISEHDYTYDLVGNRKTHNELIAGALNPYTYAYDELNRLTTVTNTGTGSVESYAYDPLGNRRAKTSGGTTLAYVHDSANQLLEIHSGSVGGPLTAGLVYDNNGNLVKKCEGGTVTVNSTDCTGSTVTSLTHDFLNRPVQIAKTGIATQTYKYDNSGRRIQKVNGSTVINYLYNGSQILDQYDNTWGLPTFNYVYGPGADAPTIRASSTGSQFYHQNGIGNAVAVTNQTGTTDGTATYDVYGNLTASTGTIPTYGFTGREPDETGFVFFRARYYDPTIGRFVQRDPIGRRDGINLYAYVHNSPINFTDPTGQFAIFWHWGITFTAALNKGYSLSQSWTYASAAAAPDLSANTFSSNYSDTIQHAMSGRTSGNILPPPPNVALAATEVFIGQQLQSNIVGEQGRGLHATQDVAAENHMGKPWPPEGGFFGKLWHFVQDVLPSFSSIGNAYNRTLEAFDRIQANAVSETLKKISEVFDGTSAPPIEGPSQGNLGEMTSTPLSGPYSGSQSTNEYVGSIK